VTLVAGHLPVRSVQGEPSLRVVEVRDLEGADRVAFAAFPTEELVPVGLGGPVTDRTLRNPPLNFGSVMIEGLHEKGPGVVARFARRIPEDPLMGII
jgi:hypothetical protein